MILLGVILLIVGFIAAVHIIWILGIIAVVIGAVLAIVGFTGHENRRPRALVLSCRRSSRR